VEIDAAGGVISARVASTSGHVLLDQAALDAVRTALYVPAEQGGRRIPSRLIVPVRFRLTAGGGR
jgi:protein TonB